MTREIMRDISRLPLLIRVVFYRVLFYKLNGLHIKCKIILERTLYRLV